MKSILSLLIACALVFAPSGTLRSGAAQAADLDPHVADRTALIAVFHEIEAGINAQDIERMIAQMAPDATVTWLNGEVSRGHDQIRDYYRRMVQGPERILNRYTTAAEIGAHARFFGDVAVADGRMRDRFIPVARAPFELDSRWTSTSARIDGQWKVVSLHLSANVFTNDLIEEAKSAALKTGLGGILLGVLLGLLLGRKRALV